MSIYRREDGCWNCKHLNFDLKCKISGLKVPDNYICNSWEKGILDSDADE